MKKIEAMSHYLLFGIPGKDDDYKNGQIKYSDMHDLFLLHFFKKHGHVLIAFGKVVFSLFI